MEGAGPSVTARRVAAHRLGFSRVPAPYGAPAADEALAADVAAGLVAPANRMHDYLAARTSFFDRTVVSAIDRGVRQVVVGAAGYDGRAFRYAKPGVRWFEVDHPATQRDKLERLQRLGISAPHVRFVEADFTRDPMADRLHAAGLKAAVPSLFLLEGVAVYLDPAVLETVLGEFRLVAAPGSRLAISVSLSREHDEGARARFQASVAALGEPAKSTFDADQAEDLLARTGWRTMPGRADTAAKRERLRSAGLLTASACPRAPQAPAPSKSSKQLKQPTSPARCAPQPGALFLSALLSQALVAFTIEFDDEAEHRLPHRTTDHGASGHGDGAWLVSLVMERLRHVTDKPITVGELETRARTGTNLDGMRRWGLTPGVRSGRPPSALSTGGAVTDLTAKDEAAAMVAAVRDDPARRLELAARFYDRRAGRPSIRSYRRAELAFIRWQIRRGVLAAPSAGRPGSPWWRAVNEGLLRDGLVMQAHSRPTSQPRPRVAARSPASLDGACKRSVLTTSWSARSSSAGATLHRRCDRRCPDVAGSAGHRTRRRAAAPVRRAGALPGQLASRGPPPGHPAALPDGHAPRRLPRRQLTPGVRPDRRPSALSRNLTRSIESDPPGV